MKHSDKALDLFFKGANCSQSVFTAFSDITHIDENTSLRLSSSFGGGLGRLRETCGACLGMCLVAGAVFGYDNIESRDAKSEHYKKIQFLVKEFEQENGSHICREILGSPEKPVTHVPEARTEDYYKKRRCCLDCITSACDILDKYLEGNI